MSLIENRLLGHTSFMFSFDERTDDQDWEKFHAHKGLEFLYIQEGKGHIVIDQKIYGIKPNTLVCFQPFQLHKINFSANQQQPYIRSMLLFEPAFVDEFIKPFPSLYSLFQYLCKGKLKQQMFYMKNNNKIYELLYEFNQGLGIVNPHNHREELIIFLISLLKMLREVIPHFREETSSQKRNLRHVENVMNWIEDHYKEEFVLDQLASELHLSPYHLSHIFREEMGCTITDFITVKRIKEACWLLSSTDLSIQLIGKKVGWNSDSYFSQIFKKNIGLTPKQYRLSSKDFFKNSTFNQIN